MNLTDKVTDLDGIFFVHVDTPLLCAVTSVIHFLTFSITDAILMLLLQQLPNTLLVDREGQDTFA